MLPKMHYRFEVEMEDAIGKYHKLKSPRQRSVLYQQHIHKSFVRIAAKIIKYGGYRQSTDLVDDVVSFLVANSLEKLNPPNGRCLAYLHIAARNYLWTHHRRCKWINNRTSISSAHDDIVQASISADDEHNLEMDNRDSLKETSMFIKKHQRSFNRKYLSIVRAASTILDEVDTLPDLHRKTICDKMRQMTGYNQSKVRRVLDNHVRPHYQNRMKSLWHTQ